MRRRVGMTARGGGFGFGVYLTTYEDWVPTSHQVEKAREIRGKGVQHCSHFEAIIVIPVQKFDYPLAAQRVEYIQQFGREYVAVVGFDVMLNFIGAGPRKPTEWASVRWLVFVFLVPLQLLDSSKYFFARYTGAFRLGMHSTVTARVASGMLDNWTFTSSQRLSL